MSNDRIFRSLWMAALLLGTVSISACSKAAEVSAIKTVTVGDPQHPDTLAAALQDAYKSGARRIVIRPGTYWLPNVGRTAITLDGWQDTVLSAYGVTLIITDLEWTHNVFDLVNCAHVTLSGPTLSQDQVSTFQGRVIAVGKNADGKLTCDWKSDAGYPEPSDQEAKKFFNNDVNIVDARTRLLKVGTGDNYGLTADALGNGIFRVYFKQDALNVRVGDWLVGRYGGAPFKVRLNNSQNCTIKDVTMMRNGFAPIREERGGGNHYLHCMWKLGPKPKNATEEPLITNAADGMHMTESYPGPDIENCVFEGVFLDDCIAIHGYFNTIKSVTGATLTLDHSVGMEVGKPARISNDKGFFGEATVTALKNNADGTCTVTLDKELGVPVGAKLSNPGRAGDGYKIIGNRLGRTRSRGILVKADNGLIRKNTIEGCGMSAVSIGPEYYWGEADYAQNVIVEGNTFRGSGQAGYGGSAVLVHGDGAVGNKNIVIKDNQFVSSYQGDINAECVDSLTVSGNVMIGPEHHPMGTKPYSPIALANSRSVTLRGNAVRNLSGYNPEMVAVGANVTELANTNFPNVPSAHDGSLSDSNILYIGRWDKSNPAEYHSYWTAAYLRTGFTGTSVKIDLADQVTLKISIDGAPIKTQYFAPGEAVLNTAPLAPGKHTLLVGGNAQNEEVRFTRLTLDPGAVTYALPAKPIIEFIGDSITAGGMDNYSWLTGEALGCDHTQISFSGRALTDGFGCAGDKTSLDTQYFRLKNFNHLSDMPQPLWNFSYTPQVVVINLGQNDQCGNEPNDTMRASYVSFVHNIRAKLPKAQIVALRPFGGPYETPIREAVAALNAEGDTHVTYIDTTGWLQKEDFGDGIHPNAGGHMKVMQRLAPLLKPFLNRK